MRPVIHEGWSPSGTGKSVFFLHIRYLRLTSFHPFPVVLFQFLFTLSSVPLRSLIPVTFSTGYKRTCPLSYSIRTWFTVPDTPRKPWGVFNVFMKRTPVNLKEIKKWDEKNTHARNPDAPHWRLTPWKNSCHRKNIFFGIRENLCENVMYQVFFCFFFSMFTNLDFKFASNCGK